MASADTYGTIILSPEPRGRFLDVIINGTPKPGVVMQPDLGVEKVGGKFTYEVANTSADGVNPIGPIAVLLNDELQGKPINSTPLLTDAYVDGKLGRVYFPLPGDELLMQLQDVAGTGDDHTIGEVLMVDDGTGQLLVTTGVDCEPFVCLETITDPAADSWAHVMFSGY